MICLLCLAWLGLDRLLGSLACGVRFARKDRIVLFSLFTCLVLHDFAYGASLACFILLRLALGKLLLASSLALNERNELLYLAYLPLLSLLALLLVCFALDGLRTCLTKLAPLTRTMLALLDLRILRLANSLASLARTKRDLLDASSGGLSFF